MLISLHSWRQNTYGLIGRFRKKQDGAAAVEFALVALPFFGLMFGIIELAIFFFSTRYLEDGLFEASRKVLTQRLTGANVCPAFKQAMADALPQWLGDPNKLTISITPISSFSSTGTVLDLAANGCSFGGSGQTLIMKVTYAYPFTGYRLLSNGTNFGSDLNLTAVTSFRVE